MLLAHDIERRLVLVFVQFIGVLDAEFGLLGHEIQGGVGDIDGPVIGLDSPLVRLAVRQRLLLEHHAPALRRVLEDVGVVHEDVGAPLVGNAVVFAVDRVPRRILQALVERLPAWDQRGIDLLHPLAGDKPQRGVAGGGDQVEVALVHQGDHFVRGAGGLHIHLAAGLFLEIRDPVGVLIAVATLDVSRPSDDIDLALALPDARGVGWSDHRDRACQRQQTVDDAH